MLNPFLDFKGGKMDKTRFFKLADLQFFIPGWNIFYMIKNYFQTKKQVLLLEQCTLNMKKRAEIIRSQIKDLNQKKAKAIANGMDAKAIYYERQKNTLIKDFFETDITDF